MGVSENRGTLFWGSYNKDPTISGTISGSPIFGNSPFPETVQSHCVRLWSLVLRPVKSLNTTRVYTPHMQIPEVTRGALGFRP